MWSTSQSCWWTWCQNCKSPPTTSSWSWTRLVLRISPDHRTKVSEYCRQYYQCTTEDLVIYYFRIWWCKTWNYQENMGFVYLSDKNEDKTWLFPGEWDMPLESLLIKMRDIWYTGYFSLTIDPESLYAGWPENSIIARMEKSRWFLNKYFG